MKTTSPKKLKGIHIPVQIEFIYSNGITHNIFFIYNIFISVRFFWGLSWGCVVVELWF